MNAKEAATLKAVADKLGVKSDWLNNVIRHESRFDPFAVNPISNARGLIQFLDSTAKGLGFKDAIDLVKKNDTIEKQLKGPVFQYLSKYKPFPTEQSLYMSIFYPVARNWSPDQPFPAIVQKQNPGIRTPRDYIRRVQGLPPVAIGSGLFAAVAIGGLIYILTKGKK